MSVATKVAPAVAPFDVERVRADFPVLAQTVRGGKRLAYLDNAASSQRPLQVAAAVDRFYREYASNVHRGVHALSERATAAYEEARQTVARFLNAASEREIVFVRGTTEAINLVAHSFARPRLEHDDEVLITALEHHSNIVPWQLVCAERGARLRVVPVDDRGEVEVEEFERALSARTRIVALAHVSNALGTVNPIARMIELARRNGTPVLVDGAQAVPHFPVDVQALGCDFYCFSGHKTFAPSGIGALWGKGDHLQLMPPYQGGGDMILSVSFAKTTFNAPPYRFEAGTPNIEGAIGLGAALRYLEGLDRQGALQHEARLLAAATGHLAAIPGLRLIGTAREKASVLSFVIDGVHAHDVGTVLDAEGVAVRAGHHCAQPLMERFGVPATARASFAFYNTMDDVTALVRGVERVQEMVAR